MIITGAETFPVVTPPPHRGGPGFERCDGFYGELIDPPITWEHGFIVASSRPGLGHDLREDVAARYAPGVAG